MPDFAVVTAFKGSDRLSPVFNKMGHSADKFGSRASRAFGRASGASSKMFGMLRGFLPILSGAAILKFGKDSLNAWETQQVAVANVEAGLKSTNNAIGMTSKQFQDLASNWQKIGIFGDETILQNVTAQLLTFGSIGKKNFNEMQGAAMDITTKLYGVTASGEQLRDITIMLGKAMDNPTRGMTALRRRGIQFTEQQENMIKVMQATEGREKAQAYLLKEINTLYGGTNEALRKTDKGMELAAKNKLGDTMEEIGKQIIPLKQGFYELALQILPKVNEALPVIIKYFKKFSPLLLGIIGIMISYMAILKLVRIGQLAYKGALLAVMVVQKIMMAAGWIKYLIMMRGAIAKAVTMTKAWAVAQKAINFVLTMNPIGLIVTAIALLGLAIYDLYKNWDKYAIAFQIGINEWIEKWKALKMVILGVLNDIGLVSKESVKIAALDYKISQMEGQILKKQQQKLLSPTTQAPNETEVKSRNINFQGQLNIAGAPKGSTVSGKTRGAPPINMLLLGWQ